MSDQDATADAALQRGIWESRCPALLAECDRLLVRAQEAEAERDEALRIARDYNGRLLAAEQALRETT